MTIYTNNPETGQTRPQFSLPSLLAVGAAIASFFFGAFMGLLLAIIAILLGVLGVALAIAPKVRGGFASIFAVIAGAFGIATAIFRLVL